MLVLLCVFCKGLVSKCNRSTFGYFLNTYIFGYILKKRKKIFKYKTDVAGFSTTTAHSADAFRPVPGWMVGADY